AILSHQKVKVKKYDIRMAHYIYNNLDWRFWLKFMNFLSRMGNGYLWGILGFGFLVFAQENGRRIFMMGLLAITLNSIIAIMAKRAFARLRPACVLENVEVRVRPVDYYSFPSNHTMIAFSVSALTFHFYGLLALPMLLLAFLMGLSRIVVGAHFPSDVIVGALLGTLVAILIVSLL
ncbi:undecaprenyl-diphosphatase, partial [Candidatus Hakubella thermalkaliphila]